MARSAKAGRRVGAAVGAIEFDPLDEAELDALAEALFMARAHFDEALAGEELLSEAIASAIGAYVSIRAAVPFMPTEREVARACRETVDHLFDLLDRINPVTPTAHNTAMVVAADPDRDIDLIWRLIAAIRANCDRAKALEASAALRGPKRRNDAERLTVQLHDICIAAGIEWRLGSKANDHECREERVSVRLLVASVEIAIGRLRRLTLFPEAMEIAIEEPRLILMLAPPTLARRVREAVRAGTELQRETA